MRLSLKKGLKICNLTPLNHQKDRGFLYSFTKSEKFINIKYYNDNLPNMFAGYYRRMHRRIINHNPHIIIGKVRYCNSKRNLIVYVKYYGNAFLCNYFKKLIFSIDT